MAVRAEAHAQDNVMAPPALMFAPLLGLLPAPALLGGEAAALAGLTVSLA